MLEEFRKRVIGNPIASHLVVALASTAAAFYISHRIYMKGIEEASFNGLCYGMRLALKDPISAGMLLSTLPESEDRANPKASQPTKRQIQSPVKSK